MTPSVLQFARKLMRRRKFSRAINLLESNRGKYSGSYEYYLALGTSCLYVGDYGNAWNYYDEARRIRPQGTELYLGQAVILLRRGESDRAVQYYLDVQGMNPDNAIAAEALEFIRKSNNNYDVISAYFDSGKIERFYPPLGLNPDLIRNCVAAGLLLGVCISLGFVIGFFRFRPRAEKPLDPEAQFLQDLQLTEGERRNPSQEGLPPVAGGGQSAALQEAEEAPGPGAAYSLSDDDIKGSYQKALDFFKANRDNAANVEINRILRSNAADSIKSKAMDLRASLYKVRPAFGNLKDNFSYRDVARDPGLYEGCYVEWPGRIANPVSAEDGGISFDLLEGYDKKVVLEGIVRVSIPERLTRQSIDGEMVSIIKLDTEKPILVLGTVFLNGTRLSLNGVSVHQPVKGDSLEGLSR